MTEIRTKFGVLKGAAYCSYYEDGSIKELTLLEQNNLKTSYGDFIPQYLDDGVRRRRITPLSFYPNGNLKNLPLQTQVNIATSIGVLPTEFVSFYPGGSIKRVLPLHGQLSGFWDEEDEYNLAQEFIIDLPSIMLKQKILAMRFYEEGSLQDLTLWPKDTVSIDSPIGNVKARIGISLYPDGRLKSFEPAVPLPVDTAIGTISAYDSRAIGIHGEANSLRFSTAGTIENVVSSSHRIKVFDKNGREYIYEPGRQANMFNPDVSDMVPLNIEFLANKVRFNHSEEDEYDLADCSFFVEPLALPTENTCSSCSSCTACSACG